MAYDSSELLHAYLDGYAGLGHSLFKQVAHGIVGWVLEVLSDQKQGAFYTSQDADVQFGDDGDYWTWTLEELQEAVPEKALPVARRVFDVDEHGKMHHNPRQNVLWWNIEPPDDVEWPRLKDALRTSKDGPANQKATCAGPQGSVERAAYSTWRRIGPARHISGRPPSRCKTRRRPRPTGSPRSSWRACRR